NIRVGLHVLTDNLPPYPLGYPARALLTYFECLWSFSKISLIDDVTCRIQHLVFNEPCPDEVFETSRAFYLFAGVPYQCTVGNTRQHVFGEVKGLAIGNHISQHRPIFHGGL